MHGEGLSAPAAEPGVDDPPELGFVVQALEALGLAAFVCTDGARVCALTAAARAALAAGRLRLLDERLTTGRGFEAGGLAKAIATAAAAPRAVTVVSRQLAEPTAVQVLDVVAVPGGRAVIVLLRGAAAVGQDLAPILRRAFGLTPAEAQVAAQLATGKPRRTIAKARGVSLQTLRAQVRSIFDKMNVTRERELMHVLATMTSR